MLFYVRNIVIFCFVIFLSACSYSYVPIENDVVWIDLNCDSRVKQISNDEMVSKATIWGKCWKDEAIINKKGLLNE